MNGMKKKFLSVVLSAAMVLGMFAPMSAQAALVSSGDEYLTTQNGLNVKLTAVIDGDNAAYAADFGGNQTSSAGNFADVFDGNTSTGIIYRTDSTTWDGYIQKDDYIQVEFKEAIDFNGIDFTFWCPPVANGSNEDGFQDATLEYTTDGKNWTVLTTYTGVVKTVAYDAPETISDVTAVRLVNKLDQRYRVWVRLAEIAVDGAVAEKVEVPGLTIEVSDRVKELIAGMSVRDKVTQMLMVDFRKWGATSAEATDFTVMNDQVRKIVEDYNFGSVIYFANNIKTTEETFALTQEMQAAATKDNGIALLIAADQEGGSVFRLGSGTALPGNMALGATFDTENSYKAGKIIGSELSVLGINTDLAPVVDVNNNANNPVIGLRSYGDDATAVGEMAAASIVGMAEYNVIGCAKHFPGHGDTATDSHYGLPIVDKSLDVLKEVELKPYEVAIEEGIEMIMTAHILYPQLESDKILSEKTGEEESLPATMSDDILTGLLKGDMGFDGIIVTDAMNMAGISAKWDQVQSVKIAFAAGADMICMPCQLYCEADLANLDAIIDGVVAAVEAGEIEEKRLNDACARILNVKENRGILDYDAADYTLENAKAVVGSAENRQTEREIAAAAVTVVKNENNVLPLAIKADTKVLMLVPYNNERAQMIMGWNRAVEAGLIPEGAEVDYYRFSSATFNDTLKEKVDWADIVIINSEVSSTARMEYKHWLSALPNTVATYCKENGKISVISSVDKPYDVQMYPDADAIVAAYGCKGSSVDPTEALIGGATGDTAASGPNIVAAVEVILGTFGAQGKLPVTVPVYDVETNTYTDEVAYPRGWGLTYEAKKPGADEKEEVCEVFTDVEHDAWYEDSVQYVYDKGIMTGNEGLFSPNADVTRAVMVETLYKMEGKPEVTDFAAYDTMTDVAADAWYKNSVAWGMNNNVVTGDTYNMTFSPDANVTREQLATFLYRYANFKGVDTTLSATVDEILGGTYVADWAKEAFAWAVDSGIIKGAEVTGEAGVYYDLDPQGGATRAQLATMLSRFLEGAAE